MISGCAGVAYHTSNIVDKQQIFEGYVGVTYRFRMFAFDFRLSRCNVENVMIELI